jgi:selenocysteine lyase/cysteine desulfurase
MNASLGMLLDLGIDRVGRHVRSLHQPVLAWAERSGARVSSPTGSRGSGILCVAPHNVGESFRALKAAQIVCSLREGAIRLSPHAYNTQEEMERVADILEHS